MKRVAKSILYSGVLSLLTFAPILLSSQESKKGWNFGPLPAVSYNSDLGFQYGVLCDIFWFGDGSTFPAYMHKFNAEVSRYTKGSGIYHLFYDSQHLIKGLRITADISYLTDKMMDFYGFNGYMSKYSINTEKEFYKFDRRLFRSSLDIQGKIGGDLSWVGGVALYSYKTGELKGEEYLSSPSLFKQYVEAGLIDQSERDGGARAELKAGLVFDTRDHEADPYRGVKGELITLISPGGESSSAYGKLYTSVSGYIPVNRERLTFAFRVAYQGTIWGEQPFYMLQNITTLYFRQITNEGLGGHNSLRGVLRNRVVGSAILFSNIELRYRFNSFRLLNQSWYFAMNPFIDAGRVVGYYREERMDNLPSEQRGHPEELHISAGLGVKAIMNRNFVISAEIGKPFDKRDGNSGLNIGLNYIF